MINIPNHSQTNWKEVYNGSALRWFQKDWMPYQLTIAKQKIAINLWNGNIQCHIVKQSRGEGLYTLIDLDGNILINNFFQDYRLERKNNKTIILIKPSINSKFEPLTITTTQKTIKNNTCYQAKETLSKNIPDGRKLLSRIPITQTLPTKIIGSSIRNNNISQEKLSETIEIGWIKAPKIWLGLRTLGEFWNNPTQAFFAIKHAIKNWYRNFDTAQIYSNEDVLGRAIESSGVPRSDFFITSKINPVWKHTEKDFLASVTEVNWSLHKLKTSYIDLLLLHAFIKDKNRREAVLDALIKLWKEGKVKHIWVSNFTLEQFQEAQEYVENKTSKKLRLSCNQVEFNVLLKWKKEKEKLFEYAKNNNVLITAYSPLWTPSWVSDWDKEAKIINNNILQKMAKKYWVSVHSIALAYVLNKWVMTIPSSENPKHQKENLEARNIFIDESDIKILDAIEENNWHTEKNIDYFNK